MVLTVAADGGLTLEGGHGSMQPAVNLTDPAAGSEWRKRLRPRGFSLVLMDKDLRPVIRKPLPWEVREIVASIDKFPLRRQEILERNPAGR